MLLITRTVVLIVTWDTHDVFPGRGVNCLFSIDMHDFCRNSRVPTYTTIEIYIGHDIILLNEAKHVFKTNGLTEIITTIRYFVDFRASKKEVLAFQDQKKSL